MTGFLAVEPLIVARLAARVPVPGLKILAAPDLAGLQARSQPVPAVHVVFGGFGQLESAHGVLEVAETWYTVVVVRNVRAAHQGADTRADAGPILDAVFAAMSGWRPEGYQSAKPLLPPAGGYEDGYGYFPLAWKLHRRAPAPCPEATA